MSARTVTARVTTEKTRWRIARWLDHSSRFCWADLVSWALDGDTEQLTRRNGPRCRTESRTHNDCSCWCAKFENGSRNRTVAAKVRDIVTTDKPSSPRTVARARWIGRFCAAILLLLGLYFAATGSWIGDLIAVYALAAGTWCWRHQQRMQHPR